MVYYDWTRPKKYKTAKLKLFEVREIREKYKSGEFTFQQLATLYKISENAVRKLINGYTWAGVK